MRLLVAAIITLSIALSGCASLFGGPTTAMQHQYAFQEEAERHMDAPILAGFAGIEGDINMTLVEEFAKQELEEEGEDPGIFDKFAFDYINGEHGDGITGTWFAAYFQDDRDDALLLQSTPDGMNHHYFQWDDEVEPEEVEHEVEPRTLESLVTSFMPRRASEEVCEDGMDRTHVPAGIDSDRAAAIAHEQPAFLNHTQDVDGDYIYVYIPAWTWCWDGETQTDPAMWGIVHTDIDQWISEDGAEPSLAFVGMYASNGTVMEAGVQVPYDLIADHFWFEVEGDLLPSALGGTAHATHDFDVPEGSESLDIYIHFQGSQFDTWLTTPSGERIDVEPWGPTSPMAYEYLRDMEPGTWTLHGSFEHLVPNDSRMALVDLYIWVPQDNAES